MAKAEVILETEVEILSGEQEADLICRGVLQAVKGPPPFPLLIVDVGGNSTEITYIESSEPPILKASMPIGAVALWEQIGKGTADQLKARFSRQIKDFIEKTYP